LLQQLDVCAAIACMFPLQANEYDSSDSGVGRSVSLVSDSSAAEPQDINPTLDGEIQSDEAVHEALQLATQTESTTSEGASSNKKHKKSKKAPHQESEEASDHFVSSSPSLPLAAQRKRIATSKLCDLLALLAAAPLSKVWKVPIVLSLPSEQIEVVYSLSLRFSKSAMNCLL
jgi:hypothetical protein